MERLIAARKVAIIVGYVIAFWVVLPVALVTIGHALDAWLGLARSASAWGAPLIVGGLGLVGWSSLALWRRGRGLPISALPPPKLVTTGPYAISRHPIYLGYHLALVGVALLFGSPGFLAVAGPGFFVGWVAYALVEERGLLRRFGGDYRFYQQEVGFLPIFPFYHAARLLVAMRAFPVTVTGRELLPSGPFVIVANHACYLDPAFLTQISRRRIRFLATADIFRSPLSGWVFRHAGAIPLRRYRGDPVACRAMLRLLVMGEIVGIAVEGERSVLGTYAGSLPDVAAIVARLGVPVIPVGISGSYNAGPRWSDVIRRRPIRLRIGRPIHFGQSPPTRLIDDAVVQLLDEAEPRVELTGLPRSKLARILWACPRCFDPDAWVPSELSCDACHAGYEPTDGGSLRDENGNITGLAHLGASLISQPESSSLLTCSAAGFHEPSSSGPIAPLRRLGKDLLTVSPRGISFGALWISVESIRSVTTERADTLQIATNDEMWQFRIEEMSVFRLQRAVKDWTAQYRTQIRTAGREASGQAIGLDRPSDERLSDAIRLIRRPRLRIRPLLASAKLSLECLTMVAGVDDNGTRKYG